MVYDLDFYNAYDAYLKESTVRRAHDKIFNIVSLNPDFRDVVDFGCGMFNEYLVHAMPEKYIGIDVNVVNKNKKGIRIEANYRTDTTFFEVINSRSPTAFVSLFSTEITGTKEDNYRLYKNIFTDIPSINSGLVSGFFYATKKNQNPIVETGGVVSYQTLESIEDVQSDLFRETRIVLPVPSLMFGKDVFEVWKILERK